MLGGVELDEVTRRDFGTTAPTGKLPFSLYHVGFEAHERAGVRLHHAILAGDDPAHLRGIENFTSYRGIVGDGFDSVDRIGE